MVPGVPSGAGCAAVPSSPSVPVQTRVRGETVAHTMAAGVSAGQPRSSRQDATAARRASPISTTTVSEPGGSAPSTGRKLDSSWPDTTANPEATPRWVMGMPARAGAVTAVVSPGTTSNPMPAARRARASSPPRPST